MRDIRCQIIETSGKKTTSVTKNNYKNLTSLSSRFSC